MEDMCLQTMLLLFKKPITGKVSTANIPLVSYDVQIYQIYVYESSPLIVIAFIWSYKHEQTSRLLDI